jgi:hypothetical protein
MALLLFSVCFEGLGRKYLPFIPQNLFYFIKDAVLISGFFIYGINKQIVATAKDLYRGFLPFLVLAFLWTVGQMFNPEQASFLLAVFGLRAYWLWWIAPIIVGGVVADARDYRGVVIVLTFVSLVVAALAITQFGRPVDDAMNFQLDQYGSGLDTPTVATTGKVRVSSTFAYVSGFADFTTIVPSLLLSMSLQFKQRVRLFALAGVAATAASLPTSGSRSPVVVGLATMIAVAWGAGLFNTRAGRRLLVGGTFAAIVAVIAIPTAIQGVVDRFSGDVEETKGRFSEPLAEILPPVAIAEQDYPPMGLGTGMQLNARTAFGVAGKANESEIEPARYLVELGVVGYVLVYLARLGLVVALFRAARRFRRGGEGGFAGLSIALAWLTMIGRLTFDHVWASLDFIAIGIVLRIASQLPKPVEPVTKDIVVRGVRAR